MADDLAAPSATFIDLFVPPDLQGGPWVRRDLEFLELAERPVELFGLDPSRFSIGLGSLIGPYHEPRDTRSPQRALNDIDLASATGSALRLYVDGRGSAETVERALRETSRSESRYAPGAEYLAPRVEALASLVRSMDRVLDPNLAMIARVHQFYGTHPDGGHRMFADWVRYRRTIDTQTGTVHALETQRVLEASERTS